MPLYAEPSDGSGRFRCLNDKIDIIYADNVKWNIGGNEYVCLKKQLGKGKFATVFEGRKGCIPTAVKVTVVKYIKYAKEEAQMLKRLNHPNICPVLASFYNKCATGGYDNTLYVMIMPQYKCNLYEYMRKHYPLRIHELAQNKILYDLIDAAKYLEDIGICHADLRAENVLIDRDGKAIMADFNSVFDISTPEKIESIMEQSPKAPYVVSRFYRPPSMLMRATQWDPRGCTMWSIGVIAIEMATGREPFADNSALQCMYHIEKFVSKMHGPIPGEMLLSAYDTYCLPPIKKLTENKKIFIPILHWRPILDPFLSRVLLWEDHKRATAHEISETLAELEKKPVVYESRYYG
jgi:serine/threonine protein kinase